MEFPIPLITRAPVTDLKEDSTRDRREIEEEEALKLEKRKIEESRLRRVFRRPIHAEPRHPIYSSPYAKNISIRAFGPKKPRWFKFLNSTQLFLFKEILSQVMVARQGWFSLEEFVDTFKDFDPTVTRSEIVNTFDSMEKDEFEELDFGKFLFMLAYRDEAATTQSEDVDETVSSKVATPRQTLILSAIANYVLITSVEDIARFYTQTTRRKSTVLHHHLEATRLDALSEAEMEEKQLKASLNLKHLFDLTGSPYAQPVPFVPRFKQGKLYKEWKKSKYPLPLIDHQPKSVIPISVKKKLKERTDLQSEIQQIINQMHQGRIPLPIMKFPKDKVKEMRRSCTVELKDYIMNRAHQAKQDMRAQLKKAAVLHAKSALVNILLHGFSTEKEKDKFVDIYQRYLPLNEGDMKDFSLWVRPKGYQVKRDIRKVHPEKYAFGTKIR
ncbi:uncharacterized protein [Parasteatoda tepidariorum]|uniref:uncharacterized protein n=1 Tax=Parasteatoda tepidariorum TaxID=114398 RepID=UPI0039BCC40B